MSESKKKIIMRVTTSHANVQDLAQGTGTAKGLRQDLAQGLAQQSPSGSWGNNPGKPALTVLCRSLARGGTGGLIPSP